MCTPSQRSGAEVEMRDTDNMSESEFAEYLMEAIEAEAQENGEEVPEIDTFEGAGLLTSNKGLVVRIGRAEFQVTVVRRA
jgi:hypothetical protein